MGSRRTARRSVLAAYGVFWLALTVLPWLQNDMRAYGQMTAQPEAMSAAAPDTVAVEDVRENRGPGPRVVKRWHTWDATLDRGLLGYAYFQTTFDEVDGERLYADATKYKCDLDSLSLTEFLTLPASAQAERREMAMSFLSKAERFDHLIWELVQFSREKMMLVHPKGFIESMARCMGHLTTAVGVDPSNPGAWYDLTYLTGIVGDWKRYEACHDATLAAIGDDPNAYREMRHRLALDFAWHCRDRGWYDKGLTEVDRAEALAGEQEESQLIRGLLLAETGRFKEACRIAAKIRSIKVEKPNWGTIPSDYAENWIHMMGYRAQGDMLMAAFSIGRVFLSNKMPYADRYYNDLGLMAELNRIPAQAREYYAMAATFRPFFIYYPMKTLVGPTSVHGRSYTGYPYSVAFDQFFVAGSLYSYGAHMALACELAEDPERKQELGEIAVAALSACRDREIRSAAALALRGRAYFNLGDLENAENDLALACEELAARGESDAEICALAGHLKVARDEYSDALPLLARAIKAQPDMASAWRSLGIAATHEGDLATGRQAFDMAIQIDPQSAAGWYNRGLFHFHQREWDAASTDLDKASELAPQDENIASLLERAGKAFRQSSSARAEDAGRSLDLGRAADSSSAADVEIAQSGSSTGAPAAAVAAPLEAPYWKADIPGEFTFSDLRSDGEVAAMYSSQPFGGMLADSLGVQLEGPDLSAADLQEIVSSCEDNYRRDASRFNRRQLALAYVRSGQVQQGRDLLLPLWDNGIDLAEMCVVLEADRALGDMTRADRYTASLEEGAPEIEDPIFWSLVAFICLDLGHNDEGLQALDAAISFDPDNIALKSQREFILRNRP
jgi:tetratricopeptide (TPR) repeat protein